jgi:hypothetical protein
MVVSTTRPGPDDIRLVVKHSNMMEWAFMVLLLLRRLEAHVCTDNRQVH